MKKSIKKLWLSALRSGKYKQGHNQLKSGDHYCCLGVLCDLYAKKMKDDRVGFNGDVFTTQSGIEETTLPFEVMQWSGIPDSNGRTPFKDSSPYSLADINDEGISFSEIADVIEEKF